MSRQVERQALEEEAARWVLRGDREGDTPRYRAELDRWIAQDPARAGALLRMEGVWAAMDGLAPADAGDAPECRPLTTPAARRRRWALSGAAASIAACLALLLWPGGNAHDYATAVGEHRRIRMADDSQVAINTASRVDVAYSDAARTVTLARGEAWFKVANDRARPFVVAAGPIRVEAVGTAFSVRRRDGGADVLVTEGTVRVWSDADPKRTSLVGAGSGTFVADDGVATRAYDTARVDRRLAWRSGELDLGGETLADAVAEMNRYNARQIVVADAATGARRLHGLFRLDDPDGFARTAAAAVGARATQRGERIIITAPPTDR